MSLFLCNAFRHCKFRITASPIYELHFTQNPAQISSCLRYLTSNVSTEEHSFTVTYLVNRCGLSPKSAKSVSKYVQFETPEKPNTVLDFLENQGFSKTQIPNVVQKFPRVLLCTPEKTLLPKLQFLYSKGLSVPDVAKMLSAYPFVLKYSLNKQIVPAFNFLYDLLQSDAKVIATFKRFGQIFCRDIETCVVPNITFLRENGVPEPNIHTLLYRHPRALATSTHKFKTAVEEAKKMGFDPTIGTFVSAVYAIRSMGKLTWEAKMDALKGWGWSEEEIFMAFRRSPMFMTNSLDNITAKLEFFVKKMGVEPSLMAKYSCVFTLSLEKRIVPRYSFGKFLVSKGLLKKVSLHPFFNCSEQKFLEKYVNCYKEEASWLLKLYQRKLGLLE